MKQIGIASKFCYAQMKLPVIADRETYYYGEGYNRLEENGTIVLISKTVQDVSLQLPLRHLQHRPVCQRSSALYSVPPPSGRRERVWLCRRTDEK